MQSQEVDASGLDCWLPAGPCPQAHTALLLISTSFPEPGKLVKLDLISPPVGLMHHHDETERERTVIDLMTNHGT